MARKNGSMSQDQFYKQMKENVRAAAQAVGDSLANSAVSIIAGSEKKEVIYEDIYEMVPAPAEWNLYPRLKTSQPDRYLELKMSIYDKGVLDLFILWKRGGKLMILAGHTRQEICKEIIEECRDENGFDERKYRFGPCIEYEEDELTEQQAKDIINDTNLYRDFSKLPNKTKILIVKESLIKYKTRRYARGERIDQMAKDLGLEKTTIYESLSIYEKVIEPLQELYYNEVLTRKAVLKFTFFDKDTQEWILNNYSENLTEARVKALKKNMSRAEIAHVFTDEEKGIKKLTLEVPVNREKEFRALYNKWIKGELRVVEAEGDEP